MDFARLTSISDLDLDTAENENDSTSVREAVAILDAIHFGELFAALPTNPGDRVRHQTGIELLEMLRGRLKLALQTLPDDRD